MVGEPTIRDEIWSELEDIKAKVVASAFHNCIGPEGDRVHPEMEWIFDTLYVEALENAFNMAETTRLLAGAKERRRGCSCITGWTCSNEIYFMHLINA